MEEVLRDTRGFKWEKVEISPGHFIWQKPVDPEIQKQMPPSGSKPFTQKSIF